MGGRGRSRTQRKHFRQSRENVWKRHKSGESTAATSEDPSTNSGPNPAWEPFATQNPSFDEYYKEQGVCGSEEWDSFIEYLRKPLPAAFRINSSSPFYKNIQSQLENDFMKSIQAEDADGSEVEAIKPLPWYPDNLAWQSNFSRNQLRKNQTLEKFHEFLKLENEIGNITRQEAVSMVPPLFLDVRPDHFVLDSKRHQPITFFQQIAATNVNMSENDDLSCNIWSFEAAIHCAVCAAPGSKTFQLLEMIYQLTAPGTLPSGLVIANDLDVQRCNLLIHQTKRMCTANLIVTNHEAQHFPSCHLHRNNNLADEQSISQLQFDRVLCDVPCSGDGTLRKAPDIWRKWNTGMGNGLHGLQVQIAMRGLALLKVGGRMVYSTCSMNPVENEAVVAEILRRCGESIELIDVFSELPNLARRPGLKKWKVRDKGMWFASYKDVPKYRRSVVTQGMFPSGKFIEETSEDDHACETVEDCKDNAEGSVTSQSNIEAEVSDLPLERCMRIVPHDQNSGAFFIAVFNKISSLPPPAPSGKKPVMTLPMNEDPSDNGQSQELKTGLLEEGTNDLDLECGIEKDVQMLDNNNTEVVSLDPDQNKVDIKKIEDVSKQEPLVDAKTGDGKVTGKRKLQTQGRWRGVDPVVFYKEDTVTERIIEFYGINDSFPFKGHLITRNNDMNHVKRIYYVSDSVKKVLDLNFGAGQQLKIASVGLKMFERQTSKDGASAPCIFRISSEGLPLILPHINKQILYASPVDFKHLLQYKSIKFEDLVEPDLREKALLLLPGCCVVVLKHEAKDSSIQSKEESTTPIAIGCWRGRSNISVMVTAIDCRELLERVTMLVCPTDDNDNSPSIITEAGNEEDSSGSKLEDDDIVKTPLNLD